MTARERLEENMVDEELMLIEEDVFVDSIIGTTMDGRAVYDFNMMVEEYAKKKGCSHEDAADYISFNYVGFALLGEHAPIIMYPLLV